MLEVIDSLTKTRDFCKASWGMFNDALPAYENTFRSMWNAIVITLELLECYKKQWSKPLVGKTKEEVERIQGQNWDRVNQITKWAFISTVSSIEYSSKMLIQSAHKGPLKPLAKKKRVYLREIINHSKESSVIDDATHKQWIVLLKLRNLSVHNATFAEETGDYTVRDLLIQFRDGEMLQGNLMFFSNMIDSIVHFFKRWLEVFLNRHEFIS